MVDLCSPSAAGVLAPNESALEKAVDAQEVSLAGVLVLNILVVREVRAVASIIG